MNLRVAKLIACSFAFASACIPIAIAGDSFADSRDGKRYPLVEIAGMTWMAKNLDFAVQGSYCLYDDVKNCEEYGRLYPWEIAVSSCPAGWHLSSEFEWQAIDLHFGVKPEDIEKERERGAETGIGRKLFVGGDSGLDIKFSGWRRPNGSYSVSNGEDRAAALWTSTEGAIDEAWHRDVSSLRNGAYRSLVPKPYALAVRCVKNRFEP